MTHSPVTVWTPHINGVFIDLQEGLGLFDTFFFLLLSMRHYEAAVISEFMNVEKGLL